MPGFLSYLGWREAISLPTKKTTTLNHRFNTHKLAEVMQKLAVELGLGLGNSWPAARGSVNRISPRPPACAHGDPHARHVNLASAALRALK